MMPTSFARILFVLALMHAAAFRACALPSHSSGPSVEPGLETAVKWIWWVEPSPAGSWGLPLPELPPALPPPNLVGGVRPLPGASLAAQASAADSYTVKKGDALYVIGRKYKVPVDLLKEVNGLDSNMIRVGQVLRIPSPEEVRARAPVVAAAAHKPSAPVAKSPEQAELEALSLQVFLDRQGFSAGPINGRDGPGLQKVALLYMQSHGGSKDPAALRQTALAAGDPITTYMLKPGDFRFIAPPRAAPAVAAGKPVTGKKTKSANAGTQPQARPTYSELTSATMLAYRTPWEFVAERFHCDEAYLRHLNARFRDVPTVGSELRVPNVTPFAIERALDCPLQPPADPQNSVTAAVVDLSRLEITKDGRLVAALPLSIARPGLRGRDAWIIRDAIPRPRLITEQELRVKPQPEKRIFGREDPNATPPPVHVHVPIRQSLAAGPNNPVGIIWINLSKSDSLDPLPYGLHGTSIPDHMETEESLGGLRLTNWDIARAARLLPPGTPLEWKQNLPMPPPAVARPTM